MHLLCILVTSIIDDSLYYAESIYSFAFDSLQLRKPFI
jgi:hypothetical protein